MEGFGDLTLFGKFAFFYSLRHEFMLTLGAQLQLPTGDHDIEPQNHTSLSPLFLWEKGMGDLPIEWCSNTFARSAFRATSAMCPPLAATPVTNVCRRRNRVFARVLE
jgi:hypothetical protein